MEFTIREVHEDHEHLVFAHASTTREHIEKAAAKAGFKARVSGKASLGKFGMVLVEGKAQIGHASGVSDFPSDPTVTLSNSANAKRYWEAARELGATADAQAEKAVEAYVAAGKGAAMAEVRGVGVSRWNLLWIPALLVLVIAALGIVQRMGDVYTARTMSQILAAAATPHPPQSGWEKWIKPDFSDLSSWKPYRFPLMREDIAIVEEDDGTYVILMKGIGDLYRSKDAARTVNIPVYRINTENGLHVEEVTREGQVLASNLDIRAVPVEVEPPPQITPDGANGTFNAGGGIQFDRSRSFEKIEKLAPVGTVAMDGDTYVVDQGRYKVPLRGPLTDGFRIMLDRAVARHDTTTFFLQMVGEPLDWKLPDGKPGPRRTKGWIRYGEPVGLQAGKLLVLNTSM
jgi:hypothetical protein